MTTELRKLLITQLARLMLWLCPTTDQRYTRILTTRIAAMIAELDLR